MGKGKYKKKMGIVKWFIIDDGISVQEEFFHVKVIKNVFYEKFFKNKRGDIRLPKVTSIFPLRDLRFLNGFYFQILYVQTVICPQSKTI